MWKPERNYLTKNDMIGRIIFWDIDGTLTPFRFNGKLAYPSDSGEVYEYINKGMYLLREPSLLMQNVVRTCGAKKQIALGHFLTAKEVADKKRWLKTYFPEISDSYWVPEHGSKAGAIMGYCSTTGTDPDTVMLIDDTHPIIQEAERMGIEAWHPSSLMDWNLRRRTDNDIE